MKNKRINGLARWVLIVIAVGAIVFNTAIRFNDVKHIKANQAKMNLRLDKMDERDRADKAEIMQGIKEIWQYLLEQK